VLAEFLTRHEADRCAALHLRPKPYAELENPLKLFGGVIPAVVIAERMCGKIVVGGMRPACAVSQDMVRFPVAALDGSPTYVTTAARLA
jgi:hypothetical protein